MIRDAAATRQLSAALFGNAKLAEVALFMGSEAVPATAQMVATGTGFGHGMVRDVLRRLVTAGVIDELPRTGGSRSALFYRVVPGPLWSATVALARQLANDERILLAAPSDLETRPHYEPPR